MTNTQARFSKEELARRGDAIYDRTIRPALEAGNKGKFVAIDIVTGFYELDADEIAACSRLRARVPDPQTWLVRVGSRYVHRFGGQETAENPR